MRSLNLSVVVLMSLLTLSALTIALPTTTAQTPMQKDTFPFINAIPNPVGVGQEVLLHVGILTAHVHGDGWKNLEVLITKPDGTTEKLTGINTDSTGGTGRVYVPDQVGTYILQTHFPEQVVEVDIVQSDTGRVLPAGTIMKESYSPTLELVVQEEPVPIYPGHPRPTEYWSRPIDSQLYEWNVIAGHWLRSPPNLYAPYNEDAPETAHILWAKPIRRDLGALVGGAYDSHGFTTGDAYENEWQNSVVLNGILYYNKYHSAFTYGGTLYPGAYDSPPGVVAVDLHTGEELWYKDDIRIAFGQIYYYSSSNQHGAHDYIISTSGSNWDFYKAATGDWEFTITGVPSGYQYYGPNGEIMILTVDTANGWMTLWNNTAIPYLLGGTGGASEEMWRPYKITVNATDGYMWNVSIPSGLGVPGFPTLGIPAYVAYDDRVVGLSWNRTDVIVWGLSLEKGHEGALLFKNEWKPPASWEDSALTIQWVGATSEPEDGVIALWVKEERRFYGFSTETGDYLWKTEPESYLDAYGWGAAEHTWCFAYGKLYSTGVAGIMYAYDLKTGETVWTYEVHDPYNEFLFANNWWQWITFITDGKIYSGHAEHSPIDPKPRGGAFVCLDAETGELIWRANGLFHQTRWGGRAVIGDSIMATMDTYDGQVYAVGKGPSKITADAQTDVVTLGGAAIVKGSVLDVSPGTEDTRIKLRFPDGVPAVADESMSDWMLYVYKQFERPADIKGVTVKIEIIDPNGNYQDLGTTTTDAYGNYAFSFCPELPGQYMVIATFEGSKAYYPSTTTTYLTVQEAPSPGGPILPEQPTEAPLISTEAAIIIAVVVAACIIGVALWMRRRK